jgi:hypothetical protein
MTEPQKFKYFMPAWNACVKANGWCTREGAAVVDVSRLNEEGRQVFAIARQMAIVEGRQPTLRDVRRACYVRCIKRNKDTDSLNNNEQDHIVALFKLLTDPDDLAARATWDAYERGENPGNKVRRKWFIKSRAPEATLRHITQDLTSGRTKDHESLSEGEEKNLARLLAQRPNYRKPQNIPLGGRRQYQLDPNKTFQPKPKQPAAVASGELFVKGPF